MFDLQGVSCENRLAQEVPPSLEHGVNFGRRDLGKVGKGKLHKGRPQDQL